MRVRFPPSALREFNFAPRDLRNTLSNKARKEISVFDCYSPRVHRVWAMGQVLSMGLGPNYLPEDNFKRVADQTIVVSKLLNGLIKSTS